MLTGSRNRRKRQRPFLIILLEFFHSFASLQLVLVGNIVGTSSASKEPCYRTADNCFLGLNAIRILPIRLVFFAMAPDVVGDRGHEGGLGALAFMPVLADLLFHLLRQKEDVLGKESRWKI